MKNLTKTLALALGVALVSPLLMAPTAVNGSLGGFSGGTPGGQSAGGWGISSGGQGPGQGSQSGNSGQTPKGEQNSQDPYDPSNDHKQHPDEDGDSTDRSDDHKQHPNEDGDSTDRSDDHKQHPNEDGDSTDRSDDHKQHPDGDGDSGSSSGGSSSGGSSSGGSSSGSSSSGGGSSDPYPPLDPTQDPQYEPDNSNDGQVPSGCADAGSPCAACVRRHEAAIQFNRNYLHIAWSISKQTHEMAKKALAFGDNVSGVHATQGLAWQLGGRPQIEEAIANHRKVYAAKYHVYLGHIEESLAAMARCESDNFAVSDLYRRYGFLYTEFIKSRYESAE